MGIEQACDSMQDDWKRLLLRMRGPAIQQARASVGCIQVRPNQTYSSTPTWTITSEAAAACLLLQAILIELNCHTSGQAADNDKLAGEEISKVDPLPKQESSECICTSPWSKTIH